MASTLTNLSFGQSSNATIANSTLGNASTSGAYSKVTSPAINIGTASTQADGLWQSTFSTTTGSPYVVNVLTLIDALGAAISCAHVQAFTVLNSGTAGDMIVGTGTTALAGTRVGVAQSGGGMDTCYGGTAGFVTGTGSNNIQVATTSASALPGIITIATRST